MKIVFVSTPFSSPTYIPLGIAYLKAFINQRLTGVSVTNVDLSVTFYRNLEKKEFWDRLSEVCKICHSKRKSECREGLKRSGSPESKGLAALSKSCALDLRSNAFYNVDLYNRAMEWYSHCYLRVVNCVMPVLQHFLETGSRRSEAILEKAFFKDGLRILSLQKPDVIGFSVFSQWQLFYSLAFAKLAKKEMGSRIILGGAYISHLDRKTLLRLFGFIDFVMCKEGEWGILRLLENLRKKRFKQVPNLVFRSRGRVIENGELAVCNLDEIPSPDLADYDEKKYLSPVPVLSTFFSRGCSWRKCSFCACHRSLSLRYRTRTVRNLIQELRCYVSRGIQHIWFLDETISAQHLSAISKAIIENELKMSFGVMVRPSGDFTPGILRSMFRAGFKLVLWGIESFQQRVLDLMNKGTRVEDFNSLMKISRDAGLVNVLLMMDGFPTQTEKERAADMECVEALNDYIYASVFHPFWLESNTQISREYEKFSIKYIKRQSLLSMGKGKLFSHELLCGYDDTPVVRQNMRNSEEQVRHNYQSAGTFQIWFFEHLLLQVSRAHE